MPSKLRKLPYKLEIYYEWEGFLDLETEILSDFCSPQALIYTILPIKVLLLKSNTSRSGSLALLNILPPTLPILFQSTKPQKIHRQISLSLLN